MSLIKVIGFWLNKIISYLIEDLTFALGGHWVKNCSSWHIKRNDKRRYFFLVNPTIAILQKSSFILYIVVQVNDNSQRQRILDVRLDCRNQGKIEVASIRKTCKKVDLTFDLQGVS